MLRLCLSAMVFVVLSYQAVAGNVTDAENTVPTAPILKKDGLVNGGFTLNVAGQPVAAAYLPQTLGELRGAIILLHDKSTQLNNPLLQQLREDLPAFGWDTLTVSLDYQVPSVANNSDTATAEANKPQIQSEPTDNNAADSPASDTTATENPQASTGDTLPAQVPLPGNPARMDAAIAWLSAKKPPHLIFLGHGAGVKTAIDAIAATPQPVSALIMVSADDNITAEQIIDANLPVLDIIGSQINDVAKHAAVMRQSQLKNTAAEPYSQREIDGADRGFQGMETLLGKQVHSWLHRQLISDIRR